MKRRIYLNNIVLMPIILLLLILLTGFSTSPPLRDSRFSVAAVSTPSGSTSIANDSTATYSFTVRINRDQQGFLDGTNNTPAIRPGLYVGGTRIAHLEVDFPPGITSRTVSLNLNCANNEVRGSDGGSGHGAMSGSGFLGWPWFGNDPAQVSAKLNETQSTGSVSVLCS